MNGLEEKTRHATKSEIDDLLAELGYQGKPAQKRTEPAPEAEPPKATSSVTTPAASKPIRRTAEVPESAVRRSAASKAAAVPREVRQKEAPKSSAAPRTAPAKAALKKTAKPAPPVMQFPPTEPEQEQSVDIPIDIPRRKPRERKPVPEGKLLRRLREALDENVEEIEVLTTLPAADGTISLTFAQRAKKLFYFLIGLLFVTAALIGFLSLGKLAVNGIRGFTSDSTRREAFTELLEPVVLMDIQMFSSVDTLESDQILSAAIWDIIMHGDLNKYEQSMGVATIPAVDVEHSAAMLFGGGLSFSHKTVGTGDLQFFYNEDLKSYHIPTAPSFFSYQPVIQSIEKNGAVYTLTVQYEAQTPTWQQNTVGLESEKVVLFTITEQDGGFRICSAENITANRD